MKIHMHIHSSAAVRAGKAQSGAAVLDLSEEDLASLTTEEREELAASIEVGGILGAYDHDPKIPEATLPTLIEVLQARLGAREQEAREAKKALIEREHKVGRWLAEHADPASLVYQYDRYSSWDTRSAPDTGGLPDSLRQAVADLMGLAERQAGRCQREHEAEEKQQEAAKKNHEAAAQKKREAEEAAELTERAEWISEYGSDRLKALVTEEIQHARTYLDERLAHELPGWHWYDRICGELQEICDASEEALAALAQARERHLGGEEITLAWLADSDDNGDEDFEPGPVLRAELLCETVIFDLR